MPKNIHQKRNLKKAYVPYCFQFNPNTHMALIDPSIIADNDPSSLYYKNKVSENHNK
ncbi:MAG: hypothetical protein N4A62_09330 [Marinisporobacter sp.]|jgi:hypothetical protein|nr:hypothetical protein [Marinisporobacter sp.]